MTLYLLGAGFTALLMLAANEKIERGLERWGAWWYTGAPRDYRIMAVLFVAAFWPVTVWEVLFLALAQREGGDDDD